MVYPKYPNQVGYGNGFQPQRQIYGYNPPAPAVSGPSYGYAPPTSAGYPPQHGGYPAPQYGQFHAQPSYPPPPASAVNPHQTEQFRTYYRQLLSTLTFNSRPIIEAASRQAMDRRDHHDWDGMSVVSSELERAVTRASPQHKLPLLYLIDSISKNCGHPYTTSFFPSFLPRVFLESYFQVEGVTRNKMEEMVNTWKTGGPGRTELFGSTGVREEIESGLYGQQPQTMLSPYAQVDPYPSIPSGSAYAGTPSSQHHSAVPSQDQVLVSLANAMQAKRALLALEPGNPEAQVHLGVLEQIQRLLQTTQVSLEELKDIQDQLDKINRTPNNDRAGSGPSTIISPAVQHAIPAPNHNNVAGSSTPTMNFNSLLQNLAAAGVISNVPTPTGGGTPNAGNAAVSDLADIVNRASAGGDEADGLDEYENLVLSLHVQLTLDDLKRKIDFDPTAHLPNRCSQCAARFPAGKRGRERLQAHLDWHFRRNRKERESGGRGANRRWLPRAEFWINDISVTEDDVIPIRPGGDRSDTPTIVDRAKLLQQWIVAPTDSAQASTPCPICKERFVSEYSEDEEEWIWRNAVIVDNQIFHATCRADAAATTSSAANRLLTSEPASVSRQRSASPASARGSTPQPVNLGVPSSPLRQSVKQEDTDSRAGTPGVKRKVGDQDGPGEEEVEDVQVKKERS